MWDVFIVGIEYLFCEGRLAVVTDVVWIRYTLTAVRIVILCGASTFRPDEAGVNARTKLVKGVSQ